MRQKAKQRPPLELERERLTAEGYTPIAPAHNAIESILADLGKADLNPEEVEQCCHTVKVPGLMGFTRLDTLPCGCQRIYRGMILGMSRDAQNYIISTGGIEGVKPCETHRTLVERMRG